MIFNSIRNFTINKFIFYFNRNPNIRKNVVRFINKQPVKSILRIIINFTISKLSLCFNTNSNITKEEIIRLANSRPIKITLEELNTCHKNRITISVNDVDFECFFSPPIGNKLYVCLTACAQNIKEYPVFQRLTWCKVLGGGVLCIDDPTRELVNHTVSTYFFGEKNLSYSDLLLKIIHKVAKLYNIKSKNIIFMSNSNGGFAALYCANKLEYSNAIVFNPNIDIKSWLSKKFTKDIPHNELFEKVLDIKLDDPQLNHRVCVKNIINNKKSRFFLYYNILSQKDEQQLAFLLKDTNFRYSCGIKKINNIYLYMDEIDAETNHLAQLNQFSIYFIEKMLKDKYSSYELNIFYKMLHSYMAPYYLAQKNIGSITKQNEIFKDIQKNLVVSKFSFIESHPSPSEKNFNNPSKIMRSSYIYTILNDESDSNSKFIRIALDKSYFCGEININEEVMIISSIGYIFTGLEKNWWTGGKLGTDFRHSIKLGLFNKYKPLGYPKHGESAQTCNYFQYRGSSGGNLTCRIHPNWFCIDDTLGVFKDNDDLLKFLNDRYNSDNPVTLVYKIAPFIVKIKEEQIKTLNFQESI